MKRTRLDSEKGAGIVEYALIVMLIGVIGSVGLAATGTSVSAVFEAITTTDGGTTTTTQPLTPQEKWEKAQADYNTAISKAKGAKTYDLAEAKYTYDQAVASNASLPKAEKKAANQVAKAKYVDDKAAANAKYNDSVQAAKNAKAAAKAEWQLNK